MKTSRRFFLINVAACALALFIFTGCKTDTQDEANKAADTVTVAHGDALPSWNDSPAKQAIISFVKETTTPGSPQFVQPAERIATFDQDGTLWVEQPIYSKVVYCLDRVPAVVTAKPAGHRQK
jgi:hypothetical protein